MVDALSQNLSSIEQYLQQSIAQHKLTKDDIDARELCAQLVDQFRLQQYRWADSKYVPHVLTVHVIEDKADKIEPLEMIFCSAEFARLLLESAKAAGLEAMMPMHAEVELVKRNHAALVPDSGRCALTLTWPKSDDSFALADITVDQEHRRIISIQVRRAKMPILARLTSLNAEVYHNNYLLIREVTHVGRLRVVIDDKTGYFVRRNDFIFAQIDDEEAICNSVSRQHAKIFYQVDGAYYVEDNGSANATRVERIVGGGLVTGDRGKEFFELKPKTSFRLQHGDIIHFGLAQVRFQLVDHIDPTLLAEIGTEQERANTTTKRSERGQNVTMRLPVAKPRSE